MNAYSHETGDLFAGVEVEAPRSIPRDMARKLGPQQSLFAQGMEVDRAPEPKEEPRPSLKSLAVALAQSAHFTAFQLLAEAGTPRSRWAQELERARRSNWFKSRARAGAGSSYWTGARWAELVERVQELGRELETLERAGANLRGAGWPEGGGDGPPPDPGPGQLEQRPKGSREWWLCLEGWKEEEGPELDRSARYESAGPPPLPRWGELRPLARWIIEVGLRRAWKRIRASYRRRGWRPEIAPIERRYHPANPYRDELVTEWAKGAADVLGGAYPGGWDEGVGVHRNQGTAWAWRWVRAHREEEGNDIAPACWRSTIQHAVNEVIRAAHPATEDPPDVPVNLHQGHGGAWMFDYQARGGDPFRRQPMDRKVRDIQPRDYYVRAVQELLSSGMTGAADRGQALARWARSWSQKDGVDARMWMGWLDRAVRLAVRCEVASALSRRVHYLPRAVSWGPTVSKRKHIERDYVELRLELSDYMNRKGRARAGWSHALPGSPDPDHPSLAPLHEDELVKLYASFFGIDLQPEQGSLF